MMHFGLAAEGTGTIRHLMPSLAQRPQLSRLPALTLIGLNSKQLPSISLLPGLYSCVAKSTPVKWMREVAAVRIET
jgi:hypothetical protein